MNRIKDLLETIRKNRQDKKDTRSDRRSERRISILFYFLSDYSGYIAVAIVLVGFGLLWYSTPATDGSTSDIIEAQATRKKYGQTIIEKVNSVYDGDTLNVDIKDWPPIVGKSMPIRINGIDTPEMNSKDAKLKALAVKARDHVRSRLSTAKVVELRNIQRDKYFRLDADIFVDQADLAHELIDKGLAKPYDGGTKDPWN